MLDLLSEDDKRKDSSATLPFVTGQLSTEFQVQAILEHHSNVFLF